MTTFHYLVYVRVSTDRDEQVSSVSNQIDVCRYWLESNGFDWNESCVFKDEGISGTVLLDRVAMQMLLEKAREKEVNMVVFKSLNRLARDTKDALEIREVLSSHNVRIISVEEGYDSFRVKRNDMSYEMSSMFAEQYSRMLSVNISGVLAAKVRRGEHIGNVPFGYERINKKLEIIEEEAAVVRKIFHWYNHTGWGYKRITRQLNEDIRNGIGVKPRKRNDWQITSVQRILRNRVYCGDYVLNQYRVEKVAGRKKQIKNPEEKWQIFKDQHPAIVDRTTWEKANNKEVLNKKRKITKWNELRGLGKCSECGSNMIVTESWKKKASGDVVRWRYWKCSQYRRMGEDGCINHAPVTYQKLREAIIDQVLAFEGELLNFNYNYEKNLVERVQFLKRKIEQNKRKSKDLLDLLLDNVIERVEFEQKRDELNQAIREWESEVTLLKDTEIKEETITSVTEALTLLQKRNDDLYNVFRTLIDHFVMYPDGTIDIQFTFNLLGDA